MEENPSSQQEQNFSKKATLESLSKEELVKKCKGLLLIAQKAKMAKDDYAKEYETLVSKMAKLESEKEADKKCIIAMKEVNDNLTENKLILTTEIADLKAWKQEIQKKFEKQKLDLSNLEIENEALKRQIERLTQENDDLLGDLDKMEKKYNEAIKIDAERQENLKRLEEEFLKLKESEISANEIQKQFNEILKENNELKQIIKNMENTEKEKQNEKCEKCSNFEKLIKDHEKEVDLLKFTEKEQSDKIQSIKQKLMTVAMKLKKLKISKEILLETIQDYSESVSNWQKDIYNASNQLCNRIANLEKDKASLEIEREKLKSLGENLIEEKIKLEDKLKMLDEERQNLKKINDELCENGIKMEEQRQVPANYESKLLDVIECCEKVLNELDVEKSNCVNENSEEKSDELQKQYEFDKQKTEIENLKEKLENNHSNIEEFQKRLCNALQIEENNMELRDKVIEKIQKQNENLEILIKEKENYLDQIKNFEIMLKNSDMKFESKQKEYHDKCKKLQALQENFDLQSGEFNRIQKLLQDYEGVQCERIKELESELMSNKEIIDNSKEENKNHTITINDQITELKRLQTLLTLRETENSDLLSEMRELNEALKGRGDVISRQKEKIKELEMELNQTKETLNNIEKNLKEKEDQIAEKEVKIDKMSEEINCTKDEVTNLSQKAKENEQIIKTLSDEVTQMRDKLPCIGGISSQISTENQSEILSTSTYSKADETARMKEVDESLEEKYGKLRSFAIKLKKKVQEQAAYITNLENDNRQNLDEKNEIKSKLGKINVQMKSLQILQNENDKLLDEVEKLKDQNSNSQKEIKELNENIKLLENRLEECKMKHENVPLSDKNLKDSEKKTFENAIREYQNEIKSLKQEKDLYNVTIKDLEKDKEKLKNSLVSKENEIEMITKQSEKLKIELEKRKTIEKKSNVLNLEIEAYEKSLNEITKKLEMKTTQCDELKESLNTKESVNQSLQEQIKLLEESFNSEKVHSQELKQQIDIFQAKMKESEFDKNELKSKIQDLTNECETLKTDVDSLNLQVSEIASEKNKLCTSLKNDKEKLLRQVLELEEKLEIEHQKLKETECNFEDLRAEYTSYKIKAQSVLRQNQTKETSRERELEEEITSMHSTIEALKLKIKTSEEHNEYNERKIDELRQDNERIQKRCKELIDLLEESRLQNENLLEDNKRQCREYQESLKSHRLQIETLTNAYKDQIDDMEKKHSNEIEELKKNGIDSQKNRLASRIGPFGEPKTTDEQKIDLILMEREDAEGSETSISLPIKRKISSTVRSKHDLIPLDELLNSNLDENQNDEEQQSSMSPTFELQYSKERLHALENQIKHLTSLLAETEQDLAKLTQLNEVLKEEVRRHERAVEREQHMHNSEYMKNVVLKFLTLNSGDERSRLVPVLNTIFKLSPEETQTLQSVAKGTENIHRSWGSYLPIWSNHQ